MLTADQILVLPFRVTYRNFNKKMWRGYTIDHPVDAIKTGFIRLYPACSIDSDHEFEYNTCNYTIKLIEPGMEFDHNPKYVAPKSSHKDDNLFGEPEENMPEL